VRRIESAVAVTPAAQEDEATGQRRVQGGMSGSDEATWNTRLRFEQWVKNPSCQANTLSAVHNVRMADAARRAGITPSFGQSPFALASGTVFERELFRDDGARLIAALVEAGVLPPGASGLLDLRLRAKGGPRVRSVDEAIAATTRFLRDCGNRRRRLPAIVAGAAVRIPKGVMLPEANLILDVLAVGTNGSRTRLIVGEVKAQPDRGGYTNRHDLAAARAQAGIYLHAIELAVDHEGLSGTVEVAESGFLVLARPGSRQPSIRAGEDLRFQALRARRGFARLEEAARALPPLAADGTADALLDAVLDAPTSYSETCPSFCDLAPRCYDKALDAGDPIVLGEDVRRFLGQVTLQRARALLDGERPRNAAERDLMSRIRAIEEAVPR
jgi:hypothetical protein